MIKKICPKCGFEKSAEKFMEFCPNDGTRLLQKPQIVHIVQKRSQRPDPSFERRRTIRPSELLNSSRWFDDNLQRFQQDYEAAKKLDWTNLADMSLDHVKKDVLGFLNKWDAFGPFPIELTDDLADSLGQVHKETKYVSQICKILSSKTSTFLVSIESWSRLTNCSIDSRMST
jgi:hypothetical protein